MLLHAIGSITQSRQPNIHDVAIGPANRKAYPPPASSAAATARALARDSCRHSPPTPITSSAPAPAAANPAWRANVSPGAADRRPNTTGSLATTSPATQPSNAAPAQIKI